MTLWQESCRVRESVWIIAESIIVEKLMLSVLCRALIHNEKSLHCEFFIHAVFMEFFPALSAGHHYAAYSTLFSLKTEDLPSGCKTEKKRKENLTTYCKREAV